MTSIHTNIAAMAALQTLRSIGSSMEKSQDQVSSGLRVETASDNAAYWSIATTMRSDSKALSAIADDLGLGAAKVDVAYNGLNAAQDVLSEFQTKLVAAKEPGVDRAKVQTELDQLKQQLKSIASSSSFNGVNWLDTDRTEDLANLSVFNDTIASSFVRSSNNSVSVKDTNVDLVTTSLFNTGGGGALQKDIRSLGEIGGFRPTQAGVRVDPGDYGFTFTGPTTLGPSDTISFDMLVDDGPWASGNNYAVTIDKSVVDAALGTTTGIIGSRQAFADVLAYAIHTNGVPVRVDYLLSNNLIGFTTKEATGLPGSSVDVSNVNSSLAAGNDGGLSNGTGGGNRYPFWAFTFSSPFTVHHGVEFSFDIDVDDDTPVHVMIDRDFVDSVLGTSDGVVSNADDMASILNEALDGKGLYVTSDGTNVRFDIDQTMYPNAGWRAHFSIGNVTDNVGPAPDFNIVDVDITDPANSIDNYISGVDAMVQKVIDGASNLGAVQSHIEAQASFVDTLIDNVTKGVGRLVDADMDLASTRIKALETQQQLAIQSLQIANGNAENILQLFRP